MRDSQSSHSSTPNFTPEFQQILDSIKNNTATEIDLQQQGLGYVGATALARVLENNKSLTKLNFLHNEIGPDGAKVLAEALSENTTLKELDLGLNDIGPDLATALARALTKKQYLNRS